ncbi:MAG: AbrB/MazE/SpoVT family DNA-binding domain-containing protein [Gemmatimonadetes bacterium]|nr:AbrB/MazE/SpoVT family DNA-binding domain-containing protein [Gemmatimonadota bacterium]
MATATLTSKGQTTIPKRIRELLGLRPGDRIDFVVEDGDRIVIRPATTPITQLAGLLARPGVRARSLKEMNEAVRRRASRSG